MKARKARNKKKGQKVRKKIKACKTLKKERHVGHDGTRSA